MVMVETQGTHHFTLLAPSFLSRSTAWKQILYHPEVPQYRSDPACATSCWGLSPCYRVDVRKQPGGVALPPLDLLSLRNTFEFMQGLPSSRAYPFM